MKHAPYLAVQNVPLILPYAQNVMMDSYWQLMEHLAHNVRTMFQIVKYVRLLLHARSVILDT